MHRESKPAVDDVELTIRALKLSAQLGREELRPHYRRIARELEAFRELGE